MLELATVRDYIFCSDLREANPEAFNRALGDTCAHCNLYLPRYSMAHVRQQFIFSVELKEKTTIKEYDLNLFTRIPLDSDDEKNTNNLEYISKSHWFCEDHGIELEFWDFYDNYTLPIAQKWCVDNKIEYSET